MEVTIWIIAAAVLIVAELLTLGLTSLWFAGGALVAAIAATYGANIYIQFTAFIVISILLLTFTRPFANKYMNNKLIKTNIDGLIGTTCRVTKEIDNTKEQGQVMLNGLPWTARSVSNQITIAEGQMVTILEVVGIKVIVEPNKEDL